MSGPKVRRRTIDWVRACLFSDSIHALVRRTKIRGRILVSSLRACSSMVRARSLYLRGSWFESRHAHSRMRTYKVGGGFTLIELLVVIAIIGVLSAVVLATLLSARTKGQYAAVQLEMKQILTDMILAQGESHKTLQLITGSGCSDCGGCRTGDLRNVPTSNACYLAWSSDATKIQAATNGLVVNLTSVMRDPWGSPFALDENEGEISGSPCVADSFRSVGADGVWGTSDDYALAIPFSLPQCAP
jgi:prepilin-type N-terminal cleavage/methylation domain-containing protein